MQLVELAYFTDDVAGMAGYYRALLGAEPVAESEDMAIFLVNETKIFIHRTYRPAEDELPPRNHTAFAVQDVDDACRLLAERGLAVDIPPRDYYWGRSAYLTDPDGHQIELIETAP